MLTQVAHISININRVYPRFFQIAKFRISQNRRIIWPYFITRKYR